MKYAEKFLKVNLLFCRASPRSDIPKVEYNNQFLPCDLLIVRYVPEWHAYQIMRNYFLKHPEYTHMVLATDDIIVCKPDIIRLQRDLDKTDYPILAGVMNVNQDDEIFLAITRELPTQLRTTRRYQYYERPELDELPDIFQVAFNGFCLMAIRRDIVEYSSFDADKIWQGLPPHRGASLDLVFCHWCQENGIPIHVDKRIMMVHRRKSGTHKVNKLPQMVEFAKKGTKLNELDFDPYR